MKRLSFGGTRVQPLIDPHRYSDLVGAIYDCVLDPAQWPATMERLRAELAMANSALSLHVPTGPTILLGVTTGMSEADVREQLEYNADIAALWGGAEALTRPIDRPWVASRLRSPEDLAANRAIREWAEPRGIIDCVAIIVSREPSLTGVFAMGRHRSAGPLDDAAIAKIDLFRPHLQRAARITGFLDAQGATLRSFEAVVAAIVAPVILVRGDLSVVSCNPAAEAFIQSGDVLSTARGKLASPAPGLERALKKLIARVVANEAPAAGYEFGLPVRSGSGHLHTIHILPLPESRDPHRGDADATAAIFVSSTALEQSPALDVLGPLFDLTGAEQRVFELIAAGRTPQEAAKLLGVAQSTVRTHLLRVFEKTGVNRQSALVRMAHALTSPTTRSPRLT